MLEGYESIFNNGANQFANTAQTAPSWFSNIGDYANKGFDFLNNNSKALMGAGSMLGAYNQYNMGNKVYELQKDAFDYNKMLSEEERKRREQGDTNLSAGFANSTYGKA